MDIDFNEMREMAASLDFKSDNYNDARLYEISQRLNEIADTAEAEFNLSQGEDL